MRPVAATTAIFLIDGAGPPAAIVDVRGRRGAVAGSIADADMIDPSLMVPMLPQLARMATLSTAAAASEATLTVLTKQLHRTC